MRQQVTLCVEPQANKHAPAGLDVKETAGGGPTSPVLPSDLVEGYWTALNETSACRNFACSVTKRTTA